MVLLIEGIMTWYTDEMMRLVKQLTLNMPEDNYMTRQYL